MPLAPEMLLLLATSDGHPGCQQESPVVSKSGTPGAHKLRCSQLLHLISVLEFGTPNPECRQVQGSWLLRLVSVLLEFGVHDLERGQEIAKEEDEEGESQHEHLWTHRDAAPSSTEGRVGGEEREAGSSPLLKCRSSPGAPGPQQSCRGFQVQR